MADETAPATSAFSAIAGILSPSAIGQWAWSSIAKYAVLVLIGVLAYGVYANVDVARDYVAAATRPDPMVEMRGISKSLDSLALQISALREDLDKIQQQPAPAPAKVSKKR
ncbi:MAG: hypothetical protein AB7U76_26080 [Pirellulales bacterium]